MAGLPIGEFAFSATGRLLVEASFGGSTVSATNSTTTPLGGGGAFNGAYQQVLDFAQIAVMVSSDVDSASEGLTITWSTDGVSDDTVRSFNFVTALGSQTFLSPVLGEFFKIDYVNGGGAQGTFRLETLMQTNAALSILHEANDTIFNSDLAGLTKSILTGQDQSDSSWNIVDVDSSGALLTTGLTAFTLDGSFQAVTEDTGTPANNRPLPVKLTSVTGDINITANDLNVQFTASVPFARFSELKEMIEKRQKWRRLDTDISYFEINWKPKKWGKKYRFPSVPGTVRQILGKMKFMRALRKTASCIKIKQLNKLHWLNQAQLIHPLLTTAMSALAQHPAHLQIRR